MSKASLYGYFRAKDEMLGERQGEIKERRCAGKCGAHRYSTVGNAERRPPS
jgi:hypothetical protein